MRQAFRTLLRPVLAALLATTSLILWIRGEPLPAPPGLQIALSLALIAAVVVFLLLVLREERRDRSA